MREFQAAFGGVAPAMRLRRVMVREGLWVAEVVSDYGRHEVHYVSIVELKDGKMWRDTRYYAEPFEAPGVHGGSSGWRPADAQRDGVPMGRCSMAERSARGVTRQ
jgi:hypothetical protein